MKRTSVRYIIMKITNSKIVTTIVIIIIPGKITSEIIRPIRIITTEVIIKIVIIITIIKIILIEIVTLKIGSKDWLVGIGLSHISSAVTHMH